LRPGAAAEVAARLIAEAGGTILVVGHMPGISRLGALLSGKPSFPPFKPGQVSEIENGRTTYKIDPDRLEFEPLVIP